ncbi:MAG: hypothetical protein AB7E52_03155 [Bdellovibrionales bacterium]
MKLFRYTDVRGNFGDDLNFWLWDRLLPEIWDEDGRLMFSGIGTIISDRMPFADKWVVLGSGTGYLPPPQGFADNHWEILCVRGPLTAKALGLPPEKALTDGAIALSLLPEYAPVPPEQRQGIVFMPHHTAIRAGQWKEICELAGIEYLDPTADDRETLKRLRTARLVIADAMHAAIVADTLRVPWIPVVSTNQINSFKWLDWANSMKVPYRPILLPPSSLQEAFRHWFVKFWGESYYLKDVTEEKAIQHNLAMRNLKQKPWWKPYRGIMRRIHRLSMRLLGLIRKARTAFYTKLLKKPVPPDRYVLKTADALRQIAASTSYLSDPEIFEQRQKRMEQLLSQVRELATPRADRD